jgi:Tfp pilus assembly protein PilF
VQVLNKGLQLEPGLVDARMPLGRAYLATKRPLQAAVQFNTVLQAEPRNFEAENWLARTLLSQGKTNECIAEFRRSLALQPNQVEILNDLAWVMATSPRAELRNGADAVKMATRACELTGNKQPILLATLAAADAEVGRWDDAAATAQKAHDLAAAAGQKAIAEKDLEMQKLFRGHQSYRDK